jgi:hypothetical protein
MLRARLGRHAVPRRDRLGEAGFPDQAAARARRRRAAACGRHQDVQGRRENRSARKRLAATSLRSTRLVAATSALRHEAGQEVARQRKDVFAALAQQHDLDRYDLETEVELLVAEVRRRISRRSTMAKAPAFFSEWHRGQESRAVDSRGLVTIATRQTATEIAKVIPIPCDLPHPIHRASAIAPPPIPVPSV